MKIFFFDIDGTLGVKGNISAPIIHSLKNLKEKGNLTFICSGRPSFYVENLFKDLVSGYICCNGRYIVYDKQTLLSLPYNNGELDYCLKTIKKFNFGAMFVGKDYTYSYNTTPSQDAKILSLYGSKIVRTYNNDKEIFTFDLFYEDSPSYVDECFKDHLILNHHGDNGSCDCSTILHNKASAISYLLSYFDINIEDAWCFGDGSNDLCMFDILDNTVAMANGIDELKNKAKYITTSVHNDGVYKFLLDMNFIDEY